MKTIRIDIADKSSVDSAIRELEAVKREWQKKANLCCEMIAAALADKISENLSNIPYSDDVFDLSTHQPTPTFPITGAMAVGNTVKVAGEEIAFIEFGAGVYHNDGRTNPLGEAVQFDTTPGSYGLGNGLKPFWFIAHNLISYGTPAYMPIYNAIEAIKPQIPTIVRQVFV